MSLVLLACATVPTLAFPAPSPSSLAACAAVQAQVSSAASSTSPSSDEAEDASWLRAPQHPARGLVRHTVPWPGPPSQADIPYGAATPLNLFDWYAPPFAYGPRPPPVLVFVHGGSFDELNNELIDTNAAPFAELLARGWAIVSIRYRQRPSAVYGLDMARDPAYVVQLLRHESAAWHIDPGRIVGYGISSGAYCLGLLAFAPDFADPSSPDPVERESSRIQAFVNDRCMSDWRAYVPDQITIHPFNSATLVGVPQAELEQASALYWLQQPNPSLVPTLSFYRAPANVPPLVNLHDGWLGVEMASLLVGAGETHSSMTYYNPNANPPVPLPWNAVYDWLFALFGA